MSVSVHVGGLPDPPAQEVRLSLRYYAVCRKCEDVWFSKYRRSEDSAKRALNKHDKEIHQQVAS